jgi:hypothetical protein
MPNQSEKLLKPGMRLVCPGCLHWFQATASKCEERGCICHCEVQFT